MRIPLSLSAQSVETAATAVSIGTATVDSGPVKESISESVAELEGTFELVSPVILSDDDAQTEAQPAEAP